MTIVFHQTPNSRNSPSFGRVSVPNCQHVANCHVDVTKKTICGTAANDGRNVYEIWYNSYHERIKTTQHLYEKNRYTISTSNHTFGLPPQQKKTYQTLKNDDSFSQFSRLPHFPQPAWSHLFAMPHGLSGQLLTPRGGYLDVPGSM